MLAPIVFLWSERSKSNGKRSGEEEHEGRSSPHKSKMKRKSSSDAMGSGAPSPEARYTHRVTPVGSPRSDGMNEEKAKLGESRIQLGVARLRII